MFIPRNVKTRTTNTLDPRHVPDIVSLRLNSPACEVLAAAEELTTATRIVTQRASLWAALATFAARLGCALSSAAVAWATANDTDDEALLALTSCAVTLGATTVRPIAAAFKRSKDRLAEHNLRLVVHCARKQGLATGYLMPMSDMINEGAIGLMKAVSRFDPSRGFRFSTMASWWIDHHIQRAIADKARTIRLPNHIAEGKSKVIKAVATLARAGIVAPTPAMIARECARRSLTAAAEKAGTPPPTAAEIDYAMSANRGQSHHHNHNAMTPRRVASIISAMNVGTISASTPIYGGSGRVSDGDSDQREIMDFQSGAEPLDTYLLANERAAILDAALASLTPAVASVLRLRFGIGDDAPMTLAQIGDGQSLSRERIRQVQNKGLLAARACLDRMDIGAGDVAWA